MRATGFHVIAPTGGRDGQLGMRVPIKIVAPRSSEVATRGVRPLAAKAAAAWGLALASLDEEVTAGG